MFEIVNRNVLISRTPHPRFEGKLDMRPRGDVILEAEGLLLNKLIVLIRKYWVLVAFGIYGILLLVY
ncbi:MAG: hypothetical protein ACERIH_07035 [Labilibaculum antarcticum]